MNIFEKSLQFSHFIAVSMAVVLMCGISSANAASNGCDVEDNTYVNAELALCNTHVYNIGDVTNPKTDADRQLMRDVVALKTTVMTQQMYKQYEYLDAMIRRFKTQLKKAVLTTSLQAAGAADENGNTGGYSSSGGGGGYYNTNRNVILSNASDCVAKNTKANVISCLQDNLGLIRNAVASGNMGDAKRQIQKDITAAENWSILDIKTKDNDEKYKKCTGSSLSATRTSLEECINWFAPKLALALEDKNKANANPWSMMMGGKQ